jgi:predicted ABC-type ATPase
MPSEIRAPRLYIVAGPNGAGKTTFAIEFLPLYAECTKFVNSDLIAESLSPFSPETVAFRAGRSMVKQIRGLAGEHHDFGFETTLSGKGHLPLLREMKERGYSLHVFFLWLHDVELALARVADRVRQGGHDVPEAVVRRRFDKSLRNFFKDYQRLLDSWIIFDNSADTPLIIARKEGGHIKVYEPTLFSALNAEVQ